MTDRLDPEAIIERIAYEVNDIIHGEEYDRYCFATELANVSRERKFTTPINLRSVRRALLNKERTGYSIHWLAAVDEACRRVSE